MIKYTQMQSPHGLVSYDIAYITALTEADYLSALEHAKESFGVSFVWIQENAL